MFSNRFVIHVVVIVIAGFASLLNIQVSEVRAENFGERSILYSLVSPDSSSSVEEVVATERVQISPSNYTETDYISADSHFDFAYFDNDYVTTVVGGDALVAPTIRESGESVAPRKAFETYVVASGDTLTVIAEKFGLSLSTILWSNSLTFRSTIRPGQSLIIPPIDGVQYSVKSGDTLSRIARQYNGDIDRILAFNNMKSTDSLSIGQKIMIPDGEPPAPVPQRTSSLASIFTAPSTPRGSSTGSGNWVWPTDWRVITQYYGWRHTGLDIDGDYSTNNYAANDGVVIYSGWRNGYGITVELDHGNGIKTRYAHNSRNLVEVGDVVTAGQVLAKTGTTGRSTGTHIHFEVIVNGKFRNPLEYIR